MSTSTAPQAPPGSPAISSTDSSRLHAHVDLTASGRQRSQKGSIYQFHGKHYARIIAPFTLPALVLNHGIEREAATTIQNYSPIQESYWTAYQALKALIPTMLDDVMDGSMDIQFIASELHKGAQLARSDDARKFKCHFHTWIQAEIKASGQDLGPQKAQRGYNHPATGRLLCPAVLNFDDPDVRQALRAGLACIEGQPVSVTDWGNFIYAGQYDPVRPWQGLFRGPLLILGYLAVFIAPSVAEGHLASLHELAQPAANGPQASAGPTQGGTIVQEQSRGTRAGNAALHGMAQVNPESIAYVTTYVYFSLTPAAVFNTQDKALGLVKFYNSVLRWFYTPEFADEVEETIAWWNLQIFPIQTSPSAEFETHIERMKAAKLAALAELEAAAAVVVAAPTDVVPASS